MVRVLAFVVLLFAAGPAWALSCAPPVLNEDTIKTNDMIFEGTVVEEKKTVKTHDDEMAVMREYVFSVDRLWKGEGRPDKISVFSNVYWGDTFSVGDKILVFASDHEGRLTSHLCGNTVAMEWAGEKLEFLEKTFQK